MEILVSWPGPLLVHLGVLEMSFTIFGCYIIAVSLGHVPAWLPMISDCALYAPEKYIFRLGIVIGSFLIGFLTIGVYYTAKTRPYSKQICLLGVIGSFGLSVVGVVNEHEDHTVHVFFAAIFFACYDLYMVLTTASFISMCKSFHELCSVSYFVKVLCCIIGCISGIGYILCSCGVMADKIITGSIFTAILEWTNTIIVIIFVWSYLLDKFLYDIDLSEIRKSQKGKNILFV